MCICVYLHFFFWSNIIPFIVFECIRCYLCVRLRWTCADVFNVLLIFSDSSTPLENSKTWIQQISVQLNTPASIETPSPLLLSLTTIDVLFLHDNWNNNKRDELRIRKRTFACARLVFFRFSYIGLKYLRFRTKHASTHRQLFKCNNHWPNN